MPAIKQQQLVSTSAAIVRNTNTITNGNISGKNKKTKYIL
jgi:hypothetical protein